MAAFLVIPSISLGLYNERNEAEHMSRLSKFQHEHSSAYYGLSQQIAKGSALKSCSLKVLIELGRFKALRRIYVLGDLLRTADGLLAGHVSNAEQLLLDREMSSKGDSTEHIRLDLSSDIEVEVLIIGSGPGSTVAAQTEIDFGTSNICVIDRGDFPRTPSLLHHTLTHVIRDFYQAGQELVVASGLPLFAQGSVIGGGSEVNSGLYHDLPRNYRGAWSRAFGVAEDEWVDSELETRNFLEPERMKVSDEYSLLSRGARKEKLDCENIPRWRSYSTDGSYIHKGMNTLFWLTSHVQNRVKLYGNSEAIKIITSDSDYVKVIVRNTKTRNICEIRAKRLHVAGGAISTPTLLAKSGLIRWQDTQFAWHPMIRIAATTSKSDLGAGDIDPFQAWTVDRTLKFGSAVSTAPLLSVSLGRLVSQEEASEIRSYYVSFSSTGKGGILPILNLPWYKFSKQDRLLAERGTDLLKSLITSGGGQILDPEKVSAKKFSTVHIFGTLPITSEVYAPGTNMLAKDNRVRVSDGSILPFSPGVNPQGIIMTSVRLANRDLRNI